MPTPWQCVLAFLNPQIWKAIENQTNKWLSVRKGATTGALANSSRNRRTSVAELQNLFAARISIMLNKVPLEEGCTLVRFLVSLLFQSDISCLRK